MSEDRIVSSPAIGGWAIVELMGHRIRAGQVSEVEVAGGKMLRIEIPTETGAVTELYSTAAIYALRPCSEDIARRTAGDHDPRPWAPVDWQREDRRRLAHQHDDDEVPV